MGFGVLHIDEESVTGAAYLTSHFLQQTQSCENTTDRPLRHRGVLQLQKDANMTL
jgi:hypothetical protein